MNSAVICQVVASLPMQCCGIHADSVYRCEVIGPPGHRCGIGKHTITHALMGNGHSCRAIERGLVTEEVMKE